MAPSARSPRTPLRLGRFSSTFRNATRAMPTNGLANRRHQMLHRKT